MTYFPGVVPFWIRRPFLILRDLVTSRERPDLDALARIEDSDAFVWAILPHAARTFSACIALLPEGSALAAAVAYLYCRMLDTYEDLVADRKAREASLRAFAGRLRRVEGLQRLPPTPPIEQPPHADFRDRAHLLLVQRADLVDRIFLSLDSATQGVIRDLVHNMAEGMCWSSLTFERQGGALSGERQVVQYCRHVLGNPVVFGARLMRLEYGAPPELSWEEREHAMRVGEMVQLANITRDVEKDLRRGVAYDDSLRKDLGRSDNSDPKLAERCRAVRERLLRMAVTRAPSYRKLLEALPLPRFSVARASAVLMLLFTERYFRGCARRVGLTTWDGPEWTIALFARTMPASISRRIARQEISRIERALLATAEAS